MSDRKCTCNHWINADHTIDLTQSGDVKPKCTKCHCVEAELP